MNEDNWLRIFNYSLILVVAAAWFGLFVSVGWEFLQRQLRKAGAKGLKSKLSEALTPEWHRIALPELGVTMADGGEKIETPEQNADDKKTEGR